MSIFERVNKRMRGRLLGAAIVIFAIYVVSFFTAPPKVWLRSVQAAKVESKPVALRMRAAFYALGNQNIDSLQCHFGNPLAKAIQSAVHTKIFSATEAESLLKYGADFKILHQKNGSYTTEMSFPKLNWQGGSSDKAESLAAELISSYQGVAQLFRSILDMSYTQGPYPFVFSNIDLWLSGDFYETVIDDTVHQISTDLRQSEIHDKKLQKRLIMHYAPIADPGLLAVNSFDVYVDRGGKIESMHGQLTYVSAEKNLYFPAKLTITRGPRFWATLMGEEIIIPIENCQVVR